MEISAVQRRITDVLEHSLVAPGTSPLHLAPGVTYSDQSLCVASEINLHDTGSDGKLRTINITDNTIQLKTLCRQTSFSPVTE